MMHLGVERIFLQLDLSICTKRLLHHHAQFLKFFKSPFSYYLNQIIEMYMKFELLFNCMKCIDNITLVFLISFFHVKFITQHLSLHETTSFAIIFAIFFQFLPCASYILHKMIYKL